MASYNANKVVNKTLAGATVDIVTLNQPWPIVEVVNHSASDILWVTAAHSPAVPTDPTANGNDCEPVRPGERVPIVNDRSSGSTTVIKILGNGGAYSVVGTRR